MSKDACLWMQAARSMLTERVTFEGEQWKTPLLTPANADREAVMVAKEATTWERRVWYMVCRIIRINQEVAQGRIREVEPEVAWFLSPLENLTLKAVSVRTGRMGETGEGAAVVAEYASVLALFGAPVQFQPTGVVLHPTGEPEEVAVVLRSSMGPWTG
jgi:hypothetical protein